MRATRKYDESESVQDLPRTAPTIFARVMGWFRPAMREVAVGARIDALSPHLSTEEELGRCVSSAQRGPLPFAEFSVVDSRASTAATGGASSTVASERFDEASAGGSDVSSRSASSQ